MKIEQKKFSAKTSFSFEDDGITYEVRDASGATAFRTDYEDVSFETSFFEERNVWFRNVGYIWLVIGGLQMALRFQDTGKLIPSIWLFLGIAFAVAYFWRRIGYTIFDTPKGRILVIRDGKHDQVVAEIVQRRRACFRSRYATVDVDSSPEAEERRFAWLHEHQIISDEEHAAAMKQISSGFRHDYEEPYES